MKKVLFIIGVLFSVNGYSQSVENAGNDPDIKTEYVLEEPKTDTSFFSKGDKLYMVIKTTKHISGGEELYGREKLEQKERRRKRNKILDIASVGVFGVFVVTGFLLGGR